MGTRSLISFVDEDGKVTTIYCHYDGYPSYNGKVLETFYNLDNIKELMSLGNLKALGKTPVSDPRMWQVSVFDDPSIEDENRYYIKCKAYKSIGRTDEDATVLSSMKEYYKILEDGGWWDIDYHYIYRKSRGKYNWYLLKFKRYGLGNGNCIYYERLADVLKKENPDEGERI